MDTLVVGFALVGIVLMVSALAFGLVQRAPISFPIIFLGIGVLAGPVGLGIIDVSPTDFSLEVVATLSLAFVLFLDGVRIRPQELRRGWFVPFLILVPGTLLTMGLIGATGMWILGLPLLPALMVGATLASTDAVVMRDVVRNQGLPAAIRQGLVIEGGVNDIVALPILLILIAIGTQPAKPPEEWAVLLGQLLLVGPLAGFAVGAAGSWIVGRVNRRIPIGLEYQALYGVGLILTAYVAGTAVGGDGFLAAFFAGLAVAVLNTELCDCFLDYGEVTAEIAMLLAFLLFGALLSVTIPALPILAVGAFGLVALFLVRPLVMAGVLLPARISMSARFFIGWFGPRGLGSLLFGLLLVRGGVEGSEYLLSVIGAVVLMSVVLHGVTATPFSSWYARVARAETLEEERVTDVAGLFQVPDPNSGRKTPEEVHQMLRDGVPMVLLDVRSRAQYDQDRSRIPGDVRVPMDQVAGWGGRQPKDVLVVAYCT